MAKNHKPDPKSWDIKRSRNGNEHISNCSSGYVATKSHFFRQVHHIVCVSSISDATIAKFVSDSAELEFLRKCLAITKWNINASDNCISLPLKPVYLDASAPIGWDNLPCHQVEHNPYYTDAVSARLNSNIWSPLKQKAEQCEVSPQSIESALKAESSHWRDFLTTRGASQQGTKHCWENQMSLPMTWHIPFSMALSPKPRKPVDYKKLTGTVKEMLKSLFKIH
ncbi:MAG: hypothetical protein HYV16_03335 [Gammaproteobacteria bacterium]|nr:hypothetical protein [Gammaproteobacteria bacterium]